MSDGTPQRKKGAEQSTDAGATRRLPPSVRQLGLLFRQYADIRFLLFNRFFAVLVGILLVSGGTLGYTSFNDDARVYGTVTDTDGEPVANATVELVELDVGTVPDPQRTKTDEDGKFVFSNQSDLLEFRIYATIGGRESETKHMHLYYKSQSKRIELTITGTEGNDST